MVVLFLATSSMSAVQVKNLSLEEHIQQVIGANPEDCGTVLVGPVPDSRLQQALECARDAARRNQAFRIVQHLQGTDSEVAVGLLVGRDGSTLFFDYDSAPCGGPGCSERFLTRSCPLSAAKTEADSSQQYWRISCDR